MIAAYWKADGPGMSWWIQFTSREASSEWMAKLGPTMLELDRTHTVDTARAWLDAHAKNLDTIEQMIVLVHWLEQRSGFVPDEHNGAIWVMQDASGNIMTIRQDQADDESLAILEAVHRQLGIPFERVSMPRAKLAGFTRQVTERPPPSS